MRPKLLAGDLLLGIAPMTELAMIFPRETFAFAELLSNVKSTTL